MSRPASPLPCDAPLKGESHAAWLPFCAQTTRLVGSSMEFLPTPLLMARAAAAASSALKASDLLTSRVGRLGCACAATLRPGGLPQSIRRRRESTPPPGPHCSISQPALRLRPSEGSSPRTQPAGRVSSSWASPTARRSSTLASHGRAERRRTQRTRAPVPESAGGLGRTRRNHRARAECAAASLRLNCASRGPFCLDRTRFNCRAADKPTKELIAQLHEVV